MGSGVPLMNKYKEEFFWRRFLQTLLGGPKLRLGYDAPSYVYGIQVALFGLPLVFGIALTILAETGAASSVVAVCAYGGVTATFVLVTQVASTLIRQRETTISPLTTNAQNILAEDDEVYFESWRSVGTIEFIVPGKKYRANIVVHAAAVGVVGALGFWYLLPTTLNQLFGICVTVILYVLGWFTLCVALYSVAFSSPPETATFRTTDPWEVAPLMRPFYVLAFTCVDQLARYYDSDFIIVTANQALHIIFIFLPLLWAMGVLPPLEPLILWLAEQCLIHLFGGSAMASTPRLFSMLFLSTLAFIMCYFIPYGVLTVAMMAFFGVILSCEHGVVLWLLDLCQASPEQGPMTATMTTRRHPWKYYITLFVLPLLASGVCAVVNYFYVEGTLSTDVDYLIYGIMALFAVEVLLSRAQTVYLFGGMWRNPLYPRGVTSPRLARKRRMILAAIGDLRRVIMSTVAPLVLMIYLSLSIDFESLRSKIANGKASVIYTIAVILSSGRAFRWVWQNTHLSLFDVTVVFFANQLVTHPAWRSLAVGLQLLFASVTRNRLEQAGHKLYFCVMLLITSWSDKKQRHRTTIPTLVVSTICFPVLLVTIVIAAVLASPLLPLFTLPIFLIGYPRPLRSWPGSVGKSACACGDTAFYKHAAMALSKALHSSFARGCLGEVKTGNYYLLRYQDRLVWVQILEQGLGYCKISVKGLELQETSCHTIEATHIDDIIEEAFEIPERSCMPVCLWNRHPLSVIRPCGTVVVRTYSDAKNQLTGVIDSPDVLKLVSSGFTSTLVWVLLHHVWETHNSNNNSETHRAGTPCEKQWPIGGRDNADVWPKIDKSVISVRPASARSCVSEFASSMGSGWLDDELDALESSQNKNKANLATPNGRGVSPHVTQVLKPPGATTGAGDDTELDFGLPSVDISQKTPNRFAAPPLSSFVNSVLFASPHSSHYTVPLRWCDGPVPQQTLTSLMDRFPQDWFAHVLSLFDYTSTSQKSSADIVNEVAKDSVLANVYSQLVMSCVSILELADSTTLTPSHAYRLYNGVIPWSPMSDWLTDDVQLYRLVLRAYRYSVKLAVDQAVLGEASSHSEVEEYLTEYDKDWYIGSETDPEWREAVDSCVGQLFSMTYDPIQGIYKSRVLTMMDMPVYVSAINAESVRAQWANLSLEMLYMTNDDEERHSIQAHTTLLRNLTVQAADPPLGYPIYSSPPLSVNTF